MTDRSLQPLNSNHYHMSKRRSSTSSKPQAKRIKRDFSIGAPSADDRRLPSEYNPSSSALSVRLLKEQHPPSLAKLCIRIFSARFPEFSDEFHWDKTKRWLQALPESVVPALFTTLKMEHPRLLSHAVIVTYFFRCSMVSLSGDLPVTSHTLSAISRVIGAKLLVLELSDFDKFSDSTYATMVSGLPLLTTLVLRNCLKVGPLTVEAITNTCRHLQKLNLSFTGITALSLVPLFKACLDLEVLKLAGIQNFSDATLTRLFSQMQTEEISDINLPLRRLKSLKLRHNTISDVAILPYLQRCPDLQRIDLSFTLVKHIPDLPIVPPLTKLSLTSTFIPGKELIELVARLPRLEVLNIGAMGVKAATSTGMTSSTAMTLNDSTLRSLTHALRACTELRAVNLVQNSKLGTTRGSDSAIAYFIRHIGRNLVDLNLSGVAVRSGDLVGLIPDLQEDKSSSLERLILNKSLIDDDCAPWISGCQSLETLEVAETRISEDGLFSIIDSCCRLAKLNITGCRGVSIANRRRIFEVWEERQANGP